jgi:hypothetical protein
VECIESPSIEVWFIGGGGILTEISFDLFIGKVGCQVYICYLPTSSQG